MNRRATEQSDPIFKNPTVTALAIDQIVHELAVPNSHALRMNDPKQVPAHSQDKEKKTT